MEIIKSRSSTPQPDKVFGPTFIIINTNGREVHEEGDSPSNGWEYDQYRIGVGEYELIQVGILPEGAVWDDVLRSIERESLYDRADKMVMKYSTDVADAARREQWISYKAQVRATQTQAAYPSIVAYPSLPE